MEPDREARPPSSFQRSSSALTGVILAILGLALLGAAGYWWFFRKPPTPLAPVEPTATADAGSPSAEPPLADLTGFPALDESDAFVREQIASIGDSTVKKWLANPSVVRRWVAAVASASEGESPRTALSFLAPEVGFLVNERKSGTFIAPESYRRYDALANAVESIQVAAAVRAIDRLEPLCEHAWKEIAPPGTHFRSSAIAALARIAATPDVDEQVKVVPKGAIWAFADPKFEELGPLEKQVIRLGPANATKVKAKAKELREALAAPRR